MADHTHELDRIVGTLTEMIVDLYARHLALCHLLEDQEIVIDPLHFQQAVLHQHRALAQLPATATVRRELSAANLAALERALQSMLLAES